MKRIKHISLVNTFVLSLGVILFFGCSDQLDLSPTSDIESHKFLWTEAQLSAYVTNYYTSSDYTPEHSQYGGMLDSHFGNADDSPYMLDMYTDNGVARSNQNARYKPGLARVSQSGGFWNFRQIRALNYYLETVVPRHEAGELKGESVNIKHYIGEGYFLRAHDYFFRLRKLGDFPIITQTYPDNKEMLINASKRAPRNEVARFILSDLDKAIELLSNTPPGGRARITKNVALLLKARVALFEASWEKYHAGTSRVSNGPGWPGAGKEYNANYQFPSGSLQGEIDFFYDEAIEAAKQVIEAIPELTPNTMVIRSVKTDPVNPYYNLFACLNPDEYPEAMMYRTYSSNVSPKVTHSWNQGIYWGYSKGFTRQMEKCFLMENGLPIYAAGSTYNLTTTDNYIANTKPRRDWRWRLFMKAPNEIRTLEGLADGVTDRFPNPPEVPKTDHTRSTSTGYIQGKGLSYDYKMSTTQDLTAFVVFRSAEAFLIYMEAFYERNAYLDEIATLCWQKLRMRAGVDSDFQKTISYTDISQEANNDWAAYSGGNLLADATLYNIRRERRCEFIGEGRRYDDLIRWRALDQLKTGGAQAGYHLEGCKLFGPMLSLYNSSDLVLGETVSDQNFSLYIRPLQIKPAGDNQFYDGLFFADAHYLSPISVDHFLLTTSDGQTISTSPIYQNPDWPIETGGSAIK